MEVSVSLTGNMHKHKASQFEVHKVQHMKKWLVVTLVLTSIGIYVALKQLSDAHERRTKRTQTTKPATKGRCEEFDGEQGKSYMECVVFEAADRQLFELLDFVEGAKPIYSKLNAVKKFLIVSVTTNGHYELISHWLESLQRFNYTEFLVLCFDEHIYERLSVEKNLDDHLALVPTSDGTSLFS